MDLALVGPAQPAGVAVYVHIPFCRRRCDYCAFATWPGREATWDRYIGACATQARGLAGSWADKGPVSSVYFGGGTPSLLPAGHLARLLDVLRCSVGIAEGAEVTVECNPETVDRAKLATYRRAGVSRLSFGVQSMVPHVLRSLGRQHEPGSVAKAVEAAGAEGFAGRYNVDLIFGAAGESMADWEASLLAVLALEPSPAHVSCYALTVEAGTPLARDPSRHPSDDDQADKYALADAVLSASGFCWYEISNWALPGAECRHNLLYWSQGEYAGVGCAAHSHRVGADGSSRRWWNVRTPERFCRLVEAGEPVEVAGEHLGVEQRALEALLLSLRTRWGVPADALPSYVYEAGLAERVYEAGLAERRPQQGGVCEGAVQRDGLAGGEERGALTLAGRLLANEVSTRLRWPAQLSASQGVA